MTKEMTNIEDFLSVEDLSVTELKTILDGQDIEYGKAKKPKLVELVKALQEPEIEEEIEVSVELSFDEVMVKVREACAGTKNDPKDPQTFYAIKKRLGL